MVRLILPKNNNIKRLPRVQVNAPDYVFFTMALYNLSSDFNGTHQHIDQS